MKPYVDAAMEFFGPKWCMFGSDWPVCELAGSYPQVHAALVDCLGSLSDNETNVVFGETALGFYGIKTESLESDHA